MHIPYKRLNNGINMPVVGFGTWKIHSGIFATRTIGEALKTGYQHIDTARIYHNERNVGRAVKKSSLKREDIFITTKLWNSDQGYNSTFKAFDKSLKRLGLDYVDLYLIHWPATHRRLESWRALEEIYASGRARAIGVSNFTIRHLKELMAKSKIVPAVNQVEFHPFLFQKQLMDFCNSHGIALEAYSPLAHGKFIQHPTLSELAAKYSKTNAQIMLRWNIQHGNIVIPKSVHLKQIKDNINIFDFEISSDDMQAINDLNQDLRTCWDPSDMR